jgi:hypothetical protein
VGLDPLMLGVVRGCLGAHYSIKRVLLLRLLLDRCSGLTAPDGPTAGSCLGALDDGERLGMLVLTLLPAMLKLRISSDHVDAL